MTELEAARKEYSQLGQACDDKDTLSCEEFQESVKHNVLPLLNEAGVIDLFGVPHVLPDVYKEIRLIVERCKFRCREDPLL